VWNKVEKLSLAFNAYSVRPKVSIERGGSIENLKPTFKLSFYTQKQKNLTSKGRYFVENCLSTITDAQ